MKEVKAIIQHIAPTLASALGGPFAGVATKFIIDNLVEDSVSDGRKPEVIISNLLNDSKNLQKIKNIDSQFKLEMQELDVDVFSLETDTSIDHQTQTKSSFSPQIVISVLFLSAYFLMLAAIFFVEVSDIINMQKGENSLIGELQILFGVLTAGVGQILSFWFGGILRRKDSTNS
ncbi:MAG: hypothetical protein JRE64_28610 [Deltaproteobacteria bacterium]|nr:hypothetical protein [Deltaproteobacteria bacterium]